MEQDTKNCINKQKNSRKGRLIVRNLSFKSTEESIKAYFAKFGEIVDVNLLKKPDGKLVGCAFVQYKAFMPAAKAIKELNAKPFLGRPIAVDWAVPKDKYESSAKDGNSNEEGGVSNVKVSEDHYNNNGDEEVDNENDDHGEELRQNVEDDESEGMDDEGEHMDDEEEYMDDEEEDMDDEGENTDDEDNQPKMKKKINDPKNAESWKGDKSVDKPSDVNEGKTVFVRNLDFSTTQDSFKHYMEQFGQVHYALLCMDKIMERPKGTGFVKFKDADSASKCLAEANCSNLHLDGRKLEAMLAVTKDDVNKQIEERKNKPNKDNRNLYLAREGYIRPGTSSAVGVSKSDMIKRQENEAWKKQMLRNLHMFISRERLCIHNLPPKMTDKQLKKLFIKHSPKGAKIAEARIMRDMKAIAEGGMHPSKGYGFVTFARHEDALEALRNLNNNPDVFTKDKRPIVEFSVENRAALNARKQRTQKSRENLKNVKSENNNGVKASKSNIPTTEELPEFSGAKSDPKIKGLPTHSGPKIRHKKRPNQNNAEAVSQRKPKIRRKMFKADPRKDTIRKGKNSEGARPKVGAQNKKETASKEKPKQQSAPATQKSGFGQKRKWFDS